MFGDADKESLGWNSFFEEHWRSLSLGEDGEGVYVPARVVAEERGMHCLQSGLGGSFWGLSTGRARREWIQPSVGDWVVCSRKPLQVRASIHGVLPRSSCLIRRAAGRPERPQVLAANVDLGFVVMSLGRDFNPRRLERYLTTIWDGGARPVVVLTKVDLCNDPTPFVQEIGSVAPGVDVLALSAVSGAGMDALDAHLGPGRTAVLLGSSGAGKSTLINRLLGEQILPTQPVRDSDGRGRHTTTSRHLLALSSGALVIDTPGMRELQLWADTESLGQTFDDLQRLAGRCRFTDCRHRTEPGCEVQKALASGAIPAERLASYDKLNREMEFQSRKASRASREKESHVKDRREKISRQARARARDTGWED